MAQNPIRETDLTSEAFEIYIYSAVSSVVWSCQQQKSKKFYYIINNNLNSRWTEESE